MIEDPNTLGHYLRTGVDITAYCDDCRHGALLPLEVLIARFGADYSVPRNHAAFVGALRCAVCGSRNISIRLSAPRHAGGSDGMGGHSTSQ